jgi:uncharacterized membrane protein YeaQ/YmgE (transglycosylase-associated protein family)
MDITSLLTTVVTGAIGGNAAGAVKKDMSLGTVGNTLAGVVGGGVVSQLLPMLTGGSVDITSMIGGLAGNALAGNLAGSGIGGAIAMMAVSYIKNMMNKSATPTA